MPKVSIIVPIYNVEPYIKECIDSLIGQTLQDIEIICVDDCGTDNSMKIVHELAKKDNRIKIIRNKQNSGLSQSRNNGMKIATAKYIMFCDSDDYFAPDMCEKMYNAIVADNAEMGICGVEVIYETDHHMASQDAIYFAVKHTGTMTNNVDIMRRYAVCVWNKIYNREIIEAYDILFPQGLKYEDEFFYPAYLTYVNKIAFIQDKLYKYRRRAGSIMNTTLSQKQKLNTDDLQIAFAFWDWATKHNAVRNNTDWYWGDMFLKMFNSALQRNSQSNWHILFDMAVDFIEKNYNHTTVSFNTQCALNCIVNKWPKQQKYCFGLFQVLSTPMKREWHIANIPIWKLKRTPIKNKYYLFGIQVAYKKIDFSFPKPKTLTEINIDDSQLLNELRTIGRFTYIANPGNAGDMLIASATIGFFEKYKLKYNMYNNDKHIKSVVYGGGGIWTADYKKDWIKHLQILQQAQHIVILPSSFNNCSELIDVLDERFIVFCREKRSYEYLKKAKTNAKILLDHDMAFRMPAQQLEKQYRFSSKMLKTLSTTNWQNIPSTAMFMRADRESAGKYKTDLDVSELAVGYSITLKPEWINFCAQLMLTVVNQADIVITDRLHVAISGVLTGKTVYMLDNTYGKLSAVYEHSMKHLNNVHFCTELPKLEAK